MVVPHQHQDESICHPFAFRRRVFRRKAIDAFEKYIPLARLILFIVWFFIYFKIDPRYFVQENEDEEFYYLRRLRQPPNTIAYVKG